MLHSININNYYEVKSDFHNLSYVTKLLSFILFSLSVLITNDRNILFIAFIYSIIIIFTTNIPFIVFLRKYYLLIIGMILTFLIVIYYNYNLNNISLLFIKIIFIVLYYYICKLTTSNLSRLVGMSFLLKPLSVFKINTNKIILFILILFNPKCVINDNINIDELTYRDVDFKKLNKKDKLLLVKSKSNEELTKTLILMNIRDNKKNKLRFSYLDLAFILINVILLIVTLKGVS